MFRAFKYNDDLSVFSSILEGNFIEKGTQLYNKQMKEIKKNLDEYYLYGNVLDGNELKNTWFPETNTHIFLSHSHSDKTEVLALAGFLYEKYKIVPFIDSNVWGYANDLLKEIDNRYCKQPNTDIYNYESRNFSTTHVHMMLNTALMEMIDKTECVIFIDTPNSLEKVEETIRQGTYSPWIYSELNMIKHMRVRLPERTVQKSVVYRDGKRLLFESLNIFHDVTSALDSLDTLNNNHLLNLGKNLSEKDYLEDIFSSDLIAEKILDELYLTVPSKRMDKS